MLERAQQLIAQQHAHQRYRVTATTQGTHTTHPIIEGVRYLSFSSNDYLGLAAHPSVIKAFQRAANEQGVGTGSAHLISGYNQSHQILEQQFAQFMGFEDALLFCSGYMANLGVLSGFAQRNDVLLLDRLNHASLIDAAQLSAATLKRYQHVDTNSLQRAISPSQQNWIVSDGIFSMDGNQAPVKALSDIAQQHNAWLYLDDAHGFGCLNEGRGVWPRVHSALCNQSLYLATLGKAVGVSGALVGGNATVIDALRQCARSWIFTTAPPPALASAASAALTIIGNDEGEERRAKLQRNINTLKAQLGNQGWHLKASDGAIQPLVIGESAEALALSQRLKQQGIWVPAIREPTVPKGQARLRITLSAAHTSEDIEQLSNVLLRQKGLIRS